MAKVKKIRILYAAKVGAILVGLLGIFAGIIYSFGGTLYDLYNTGGLNKGTALAYGALLVMPVYFTVIGFIGGALSAFIYNLLPNKFKLMSFNSKRDFKLN